MSHLFGMGGNPFGTPVGQLVEKATDGSQASENWGLFMEVCDLVNEMEDGPKDALKAIRKRLSHNAGKNYQVVMYTLTLLESCVKNCGRRFHVQVAHKDFLQDLIKIIGPKNDPPQVVQEKILSLIQTWADAFQGVPDLKEVAKVYQDLKHKGIEFPPTDLDSMAPIDTPTRVVHSPPRTQSHDIPAGPNPYPAMAARSPPQQAQPMVQPMAQPQAAPQGPVMLQPEQLAKLKSELDIVQQNINIFSEMMTELSPAQENRSDLELLQDLNRTCRQMQTRVVDLIERVQNEDVTGELLRINDELNNVFLRYERFERLRAAQPPAGGAAVSPVAAVNSDLPPPYPAESDKPVPVANLIDLGDTQVPAVGSSVNPGDINVQLSGLNIGANSVSSTLSQMNTTTATNAGPEDDFDMFAQSRQSFEQSKAASGTAGTYMNQSAVDTYSGGLMGAVQTKAGGNPPLPDSEKDYAEMEKWLEQNPPAATGQPQDSATSSEFDRFLAERAQEVSGELSTGGTPQSAGQPRGGRQMQKDGDGDNSLFAL